MNAYEFQVEPKDGCIKIPVEYQDKITGTVRVIILGQKESSTASPSSSEPRPFGLCAGEFVVPEDFDEPLPQDVLELFEGR